MMATRTQVRLTCDLCGSPEDVQTRAIGLDGKTYEIDLCQKDNEDLSRLAAGYLAKARKVTAGRSPRRKARGPQRKPETKPQRRPEAKPRRRPEAKKPEAKRPAPEQPAKATVPQQGKGILVYGILPDDIEVADDMPGIGERPGPLRIVRSDGLAALISVVGPPGRLGTPDDLRAYREILDGTATEVPVLPLRFGTVLASVDAVADELLAAHHDEFAGALAELEDCAGQRSEVQRVIGNLARQWAGRIELEPPGPPQPAIR
jgi:Gas vesicle synthesis protein GvpL/GvpF/Lsr2